MKIWIISPDYGCEGYGEPIHAFKSYTQAKAKLMTLKKPSNYEITEVELEEDKP